jgi:glucose-6-phosphate isomerase
MKIDLSPLAGFPLYFDPYNLLLESSGEFEFRSSSRQVSELKDVLLWPDALPGDHEAYRLYFPLKLPEAAQRSLDRYELTYGPVLLPALKIGQEFIKTHGHYHPLIPGTPHSYPEIYTQLYGNLFLLLQKRITPDTDDLADCVIVEMLPGFSITLPPGYSHVLINASPEPALMAGLYGVRFKPDYTPIKRRQGQAYYLLSSEPGMRIEPNPKYPDAPPLHWLNDLNGTPFEPPDPGRPVWTAFLEKPEKYEFLTQPEAALQRFPVL